MDLERVGAVFELVARRVALVRQLARLADERQTESERIRHRGADDEAARLDAEDHVDTSAIAARDPIDDLLECRPRREQRRDVLEDDAGLRKVADVADVRLQLVEGHVASSSACCAVSRATAWPAGKK